MDMGTRKKIKQPSWQRSQSQGKENAQGAEGSRSAQESGRGDVNLKRSRGILLLLMLPIMIVEGIAMLFHNWCFSSMMLFMTVMMWILIVFKLPEAKY
jgi:hypothetical protein